MLLLVSLLTVHMHVFGVLSVLPVFFPGSRMSNSGNYHVLRPLMPVATTPLLGRCTAVGLMFFSFLVTVMAGSAFAADPADDTNDRTVVEPPQAFFELVDERHRDAARAFYKKYLDIGGLPVVAAVEVADEALLRTHDIVQNLRSGLNVDLPSEVSSRSCQERHHC